MPFTWRGSIFAADRDFDLARLWIIDNVPCLNSFILMERFQEIGYPTLGFFPVPCVEAPNEGIVPEICYSCRIHALDGS